MSPKIMYVVIYEEMTLFIDNKALDVIVHWNANTMTCKPKLVLADRLSERHFASKMV